MATPSVGLRISSDQTTGQNREITDKKIAQISLAPSVSLCVMSKEKEGQKN
jgi:hypothetical protein